ncbi:MAG: hypothetical protein HN975_16405 [Anaerolineae bacterium]|jgi:flavin-dependent dehydrogenase|nr:hypothetical protein [Anaerolineae bacterium]MBT7072462.1 hypothetical protein [Anaerolineae bacterium]MBT7989338.1 hypothetical protein [Anaerolineae bacterium]
MDATPLSNGARVVIIGGGPGGTGCALALQNKAAQMGRRIQITILEGKRFSGEHHYNQCAGVLSPPLPELLKTRLNVPFPTHLGYIEIPGYVLHTGKETITLDGDEHPSTALRRIQFDEYMLRTAQERGIAIQTARAVDLEFHPDRVVIYAENATLEADVVVGAFGLDEGTAALFARHTAYRPPDALSSVVTKYHPESDSLAAFGSHIHAFLPAHPHIEFGAVTPKKNHLTINIAGRSVDATHMQTFLADPQVRAALPSPEQPRQNKRADFQFYKGRFPCSKARNYYGDRYVMVGDAAGLVRAFKGKGVTSAVLTGIRAAETILQTGISQQAFNDSYRTANQDILRDLPYGRAMRQLTIIMSRFGLLDSVVRAAQHDITLQRALFDAVSAHAPYSEIAGKVLQPQVIWGVLRAFVS